MSFEGEWILRDSRGTGIFINDFGDRDSRWEGRLSFGISFGIREKLLGKEPGRPACRSGRLERAREPVRVARVLCFSIRQDSRLSVESSALFTPKDDEQPRPALLAGFSRVSVVSSPRPGPRWSLATEYRKTERGGERGRERESE